jgi:hypothetical protein
MAKDYSALVQKLKQRTNPDGINEQILFSESFNAKLGKITYNSGLEYVRRAMKGVSDDYTKKSLEAGENVKTHLKNCLSGVSYEYQGSVMTNTHIVGNSDIDLLVISEESYYYNHVEVVNHLNTVKTMIPINESAKTRLTHVIESPNYSGDTKADLRRNRISSESKLRSVYTNCNTEKPKAIEITNLSLNRDVDVVIGIWHYTSSYITTQNADFKKIKIYDKDLHETGRLESPFLSIKRINDRDNEVNGRLKKMIRLLKNLKYDSLVENIPLSSFEINAICYGINPKTYEDKNFLELVEVLLSEMSLLSSNEAYRNNLTSVDGSEPIFKGKPEKLKGLNLLLLELQSLGSDVLSEIQTTKFLRA